MSILGIGRLKMVERYIAAGTVKKTPCISCMIGIIKKTVDV